MRTALRLTALGIALGGTVFWLFGGPNLGWTRTQVPVPKRDPVTELEYVEWQKNFVPGVDFLGGVIAVSGVLMVGSLLVGRGARKQPDPRGR